MKDQEIAGVLRRLDNEWGSGYELFCPGCGYTHFLAVEKPNRHGAKWDFSGDAHSPTFSPSLVVTVNADRDPDFESPRSVCHSFIRNGNWEFLSDSTHQLAGKTVPIPAHPGAVVRS